MVKVEFCNGNGIAHEFATVSAGWDCSSSQSKGNILAYSLICLAIRSSLVSVLTESALWGRWLGAGVCSLFQLIGLAL